MQYLPQTLGPLKAYKSRMEFKMYHPLDALETTLTALGLMVDIADRAIQDLDTLTFRIILLLVNLFLWGQGVCEKYGQNDAHACAKRQRNKHNYLMRS